MGKAFHYAKCYTERIAMVVPLAFAWLEVEGACREGEKVRESGAIVVQVDRCRTQIREKRDQKGVHPCSDLGHRSI
jgi:hypothetical protein